MNEPTVKTTKPKKKKRGIMKSLSFKLYGILLLFLSFILIVSLFSWRSLLEVVNIQKILATKNIPELILAGNIVQQSERLLKSAPQLIASPSEVSAKQIKKEIQQDSQILQEQLNTFEKSTLAQNSLELQGLVQKMTDNLKFIEQSVGRQRSLLQKLKNMSDQIRKLNLRLYKTLVVEIDDKTFALAIQTQAISTSPSSPAKPTSQQAIQLKDILLYKELLSLQAQMSIAVNLLREAGDLSNADLIQPIRERFLASIQSCERSVQSFAGALSSISKDIQSLKRLGLGEGKNISLFDLKKQILNIEKKQNQYLEKNREIASQLSETIKNIHLNIKASGKKSTVLFKKSLKKNQTLLLAINIISLAGFFIAVVFLVAPLARRLNYLAKKMQSMSKGGLKDKVNVQGQDETADMARALEALRLYALEAQRLGLVEKLAGEVQEKNKKLEETIGRLKKTQRQLAVQDKLASLGQLTAGIAHEIKNPLNFINNFAKISQELLKELDSDIQKIKPEGDEKMNISIQENMKDIKSNMEKISQHGDRVSDIITGMLEHSRRATGQKEQVNINRYMEIYSNLAFHSKRASNSSFNMSFKKDLDKSLEPITAVPQDISRIILNLVANACDAIEEDNKKNKNYWIELKTKKIGNQVEIKIRDNGTGIPENIKDKIFNPFWTTKETGKGTGLGLSLTHDIVLKYGGALSVQSKEGEWTEFILSLPTKKEPAT